MYLHLQEKARLGGRVSGGGWHNVEADLKGCWAPCVESGLYSEGSGQLLKGFRPLSFLLWPVSGAL